MGKDLFNTHLSKFSIRKLNIGVCSVLLSTLILLGTATQVSAEETSTNGSQNEISKADVTESPVISDESTTYEQVQNTEKTESVPDSEKSQSADNPIQRNSGLEEVEKTSDSIETKSGDDIQSTVVGQGSTESQVVAENSGVKTDVTQASRSRRVRRDATPTGQENSGTTGVTIGTGPAGADDATSKPRVPKPSLDESVKKDSVQLAKQISWLDFSDSASWKNLDQRGGLKVGTTFTKEISPGYVVTLTVKELKPFNSTEIYKKRVAGTATEGTYNPDAENGFLTSAPYYGKTPPPSVTGAAQNEWTTIRDQGFNTQKRKTQLVYPMNSTNWGVKFDIEATYLGKRVAPTVVMADGEDANPGEFAIFTTNGTGWEYMGEWKMKSPAKEAYTVITKKMLDDEDVKRRGLLILKDKSVDWYKYLSPDTVTGGLGSQVFGPNRSNERTVPVVMTRGASEVGFYVASSGQQAMMMGFLVVDGSDAPESYGEAFHTISTRDSVTNDPINQPYLGTTPADIDVESSNDWVLDDKKELKDEGASQLLADDQLSTSNDLLDLDKAKNGTYTIKIKANPNGNAKSYVKAWIDFNNDGVFNESEGSNIQEITAAGDYTLTFNANPNISGGQVDKLGMRFRIATNKGDIEQPTGIAFSGEVEDMLLHRIYSPKGEKQTTDGFTGETQTAVLHFTPKGTDRSDDSVNTVMSTQAPQVLDNSGTAIAPTNANSYVRPEGTYRVTVNGNDVQVTFTPKVDFSGTADGINIRWTDSNGTSTGWTSTDASDPNKNDQLTTMDGRYVPTVRKIPNYESSDLQGLEQNKTLVFNDDDTSSTPVTPDASRPASFVDASSQPVAGNTVPAMSNGQQVGIYELDPNTGQVIFKPIKTFYGTPDPVVVQVSDTDGKAHRARYQPKVTQVTPRSTNAESTGLQGQAQSGKPTFTAGDPAVPLDDSKPMTFEDGQPTKTVQGVGVYTINSDGSITFTPEKQYVGTPAPVTVKRVDKNGTEVTATYTPTVTKVTPTSTNATSTGPQGVPQTGTPTFQGGDPLVPIDETVEPTFADGSKEKTIPGQGTYTIAPDGTVTFTPDKQFVGKPDPVTVKRVDKNGTEVTATYSPEFTKVTPTGTGDKTEGLQGQVQEGKVTFTPGHDSVPFPADSTPLFDNGTAVKEVPNVGKFEVNADGKVTFTPDKQFKGETPELELTRMDANGTPVTVKYQAVVKEVTPTSTNATSNGIQGQPQKGTPTFTEGNPLVPIDDTKPMTFEDGQSTKTVPGVGEYSINPDGSITFTPDKKYVGTPNPVTVKRVDKNGTEVTATYTPTVTKVTPTGTGATSTGPQGVPQTGTPTFQGGDPLVPIDETVEPTFADGSKEKNIPGQGTYTIAPDGTVTFTPDKQFVGNPDPVTVKRVDKNGTEVTATYSPEFTKVTPTSTDATSNGIQGQPQKGTPTFTEGNPLVPIDDTKPMTFEDGQSTKPVPGVGEYSINPDGSITFTPDKKYVGTPNPVTVKRVDKNGTEVTATYTPTVTKVTPTSTDATSNGIQGQPQKGTPTFTEGNPLVPIDDMKPMTFEDGQSTKPVPGVGEYSINPDGSITFTPDKKYVGTPNPVTVKRVDKNGTEVTATYTPTVTKVTPTSTNATSTGPQGVPQTGTPTFQGGDPLVPIDETVEPTFADGSKEKSISGQGTYTIAPDGTVTFTPDKQFVGKPDPVTVKRVDKNGTSVTATYSPEFTKVTPTGTGDKTEGLQGQVQEGKVNFTPGHDSVPFPVDSTPLFDNGTTVKEVPNVGKFEVNADGKVTFTPDKQFKGETPELELTRMDANGTPVTVKYQAVVKEVTPTSTDATSNGIQGQPQKGTPTFQGGDPLVPIDETVEPTFEDGSKEKTIPGQGTYTIAPDGTVTFTPGKQFVGKPDPITVKRVDKNGTEVTATYSPEFTKVTPTGTGATSTGPQGLPQTGTPTFQGGDPLVPIDETVEPTFEDGSKEKTIPGQGTYTIAPDGTVTFTPDKQFVGNPDPVTVKRVDKNGTPVTATYSPEFTKVTPTGTGATSTGPQGLPQTGTPTFQGGDPLVPIDETVEPTFEDGSKEKVIPGQGTYTIAPDGTVTFTPDKQFVGKPDPVTVKRVDKNGTEVTATYSPEFTKVTPTGTGATSTGPQGLPQTGTPTFQGGDTLVPIDETVEPTFEDGSKEKTIPGQGTYTIAPDGTVTFTPDKQFVGKPDPITVKRVDKNGTEVTATYSPEFTKVTPTGTGATSTGPQGLPQTGTPTFQGGDPLVPIDETVEPTFEDGSKEKTIPGQGTYTIAPDGTVTFTPDKQFVGKPDPVTVKRVDKNGTSVTATYSPEFTKVTPTGTGATSTGPQGLPQTGTPTFQGGDPLVPIDETVAPTFEDGSTEKVIPGEGTYTISPDGIVTFTPEADFVGKGTGVTIVRKDKNGTPVTASYRPTVVDPSTGQDTTSTGAKGQTQVATPAFEGHIDSTVPPTFEDGSTTLVVPGEGSYTIDKDGKITFTPEPDFVGTAKGVVVKRLDIYGNVVTAQYTPTVIGQTRVEDVTSDGLKGQTQTGKPIFEGDVDLTVAPTFEDGSTEKVVPGEGTYTISPDGVVTFVPEPNFVGTAKGVVVIRKDRNGQTISASYTPRVTEIPVVPNRPSTPEQPKVPVIPAEPAVAVQTPKAEERVEPVYVDPKDEKGVLPRTGSQASDQTASGLLAAIASLTFFGLANRKKKSEED
ncbi:GEVED domain-containing protein [Streptococcus gordonii]|uniref:GEVED domain-containing protein n=6 Tax=Streptococcus gordonii TaxID=1302 RepID=UPI000DA36625|nr:GEVED domain-containing protein [Streptococcus gordonii]QWZ58337.1 YSIRK-type signal peptide-containing protein [Streptococcus gordonii]SQF29086.1 surface-associated protein CshB [Streptococcus gordonii]